MSRRSTKKRTNGKHNHKLRYLRSFCRGRKRCLGTFCAVFDGFEHDDDGDDRGSAQSMAQVQEMLVTTRPGTTRVKLTPDETYSNATKGSTYKNTETSSLFSLYPSLSLTKMYPVL